jgi:hypothetical protein
MKPKHGVTYRQLEHLLLQLGFVETARDDQVIVYQHAAADSLILLPAKGGDREAREADLMSAERHLVGWGHIEEADFEDFLQHGVFSVDSRSPN